MKIEEMLKLWQSDVNSDDFTASVSVNACNDGLMLFNAAHIMLNASPIDYADLLRLAEEMIEYYWDNLHIKAWKLVPDIHRKCYSASALLKSLCLLHFNEK